MAKANIAISKIRCSSPNLKKTALLNRNNLKYIATRPGVDLSPLHKDDDPSVYVRYIHERPRSHGLFGNLPDDKLGDLDGLCKDVYKLSKKRNLYKGIVSLTEEEATRLGYTRIDAWNDMLKATLPDVGQKFKIPIQQLSWVAAVHNEPGHPHVHYVLWRNDDKIQSPYIHTSVQNQCREIFSSYIFTPDREAYVKNRTVFRDTILNKQKELMDSIYVPGIVQNKAMGKIEYPRLYDISEQLFSLVDALPTTGRLAYKFLPPATKENVDGIIQQILGLPQFSREYADFQNTVNALASTYSVGARKKNAILEKADNDLRTRMSNIVLKHAKQILTDGSATAIKNMSASINPKDTEENDEYKQLDDNELTDSFSELAPTAFNLEKPKSLDTLPEEREPVDLRSESVHKSLKHGNIYDAFDVVKLYIKTSTAEGAETMKIPKLISQLENFVQSSDSPLQQLGQAHYYLGKILSKQGSNHYDLLRSIHFFENAAEYHNPHALCDLAKGYIYSSPLITEKNNCALYHVDNVIEKLKELAAFEGSNQKEVDEANYYLGRIYLKQESPNYNFEKALKCLLPLAESGNVHAQTDIGSIYLWGKHGSRNLDIGKAWLEKAAQQNYEPAQRQLDMYTNIIQNQLIYHSYSLCSSIFSQLATQSHQSRAYAMEHLITHSKKLQKEQERKNQVKGIVIE